ncbi:MAG: hypothetical protein N2517_09510, partial [Ignavibacteria bacterium]|nr:hypothetical protein [Ignavibacteria bacterium]
GLDNAKIENIINFLCDGSSGHDYLLHWKEAKNDLGLNVEITDNEFYDLIKRIYDDISEELGLLVPFEPKILLSEKEELDYEFKRILIESVNYGSNFFLSKGKLKNLKEQGYIQDYRSFEGWCFEESEIKNSMALKREK